jgi:transcriptional regulator with XRE-family HTH domain
MLCPHRATIPTVDEGAREAFRQEVTRDFATNLRRERKRAGLTQEALGLAAGINRTHVGYLERRRRTPELPTIRLLSGALGIGSDRLVDPPDADTPKTGTSSRKKST